MKLTESLYVDDVNTGSNSVVQGFEFYKKAKTCLDRQTEDFHPKVTVDQAEGLCHRITLHLVGLALKLGHCITVFELG